MGTPVSRMQDRCPKAVVRGVGSSQGQGRLTPSAVGSKEMEKLHQKIKTPGGSSLAPSTQ